MPSVPRMSLRCTVQIGVSLLSIGGIDITGAQASPKAAARIDGYTCAQVDPELFPRQNWSERGDPYGIPLIEWDRITFDALKRRMTACATEANRRRTVMMLRYIDDQPFGRQAQITAQVEALRAKQAGTDRQEADLHDAMRAAETDPDLDSRRNRITAIEKQLARGGIPSGLELELRSRLDPLRSAIADQDEKNAAANAEAEVRRQTEEANRVEEQRKLAQQQEDARQAEVKTQQATAQALAAAEQAEAERLYARKAPGLTPAVRAFLEQNPQFKAGDARDGLLFLQILLDASSLTLETCRSMFDGYQADWVEVQRRYGIVQQVLISYHGVLTDQLAAEAKKRREVWKNNGETGLRGNNAFMARQACSQAIAGSTSLADFTR